MAYAVINKSGCDVRKGNIQLRLDFFLDESDPRYAERYLYLVDTTSAEYLADYKGEVDKEGNPINQEDYDKWYESLPRVWQNTPFHSHFVYFDSDLTEEDIKAAIELHLPNFYKAFQERCDEIPGGMRRGWLTETRIKPVDHSKNQARVQQCQAALNKLAAFSYKPPSDGVEGQTFPSTDIDIGSGAIDRASTWANGYTTLDRANPANDTGTIDTFEVWAYANMTGTNKVGTFYGSVNSWTSRDWETIGTVTSGAKRTFTGLSIDVSTNDLAGIYYSVGILEQASSGGSGGAYKSGDQFGTGTQTFSNYNNGVWSIYGTGETPVVDDHKRSAFFPFM